MAAILEQVQRTPEGQLGLIMAQGNEAAPERDAGEDPRVLLRLERERRILQRVVGFAALVPVASGLYGVLFGPSLTGDVLGGAGDSHYRYLSGLLLGMGLLFWSTIPNIEATGPRFRLLTLLVLIGGLARLFGAASPLLPPLSVLGALAMELFVTPLLCLWQWRIARLYLMEEKKPLVMRTAPATVPRLPKAAEAAKAPTPRPTPTTLPQDLPEPIPASDSGPAAPPLPSPTSAHAGKSPHTEGSGTGSRPAPG